MSLVTLAIVNGVLVAALVGGLAYVCSIPFRIDRVKPLRSPRVAQLRVAQVEQIYERTAA